VFPVPKTEVEPAPETLCNIKRQWTKSKERR